jgi:hypothetical protein
MSASLQPNPDELTSHSTKLANYANQVAGYPPLSKKLMAGHSEEWANAVLRNFQSKEQSHA